MTAENAAGRRKFGPSVIGEITHCHSPLPGKKQGWGLRLIFNSLIEEELCGR
jgi:hypothetical protein